MPYKPSRLRSKPTSFSKVTESVKNGSMSFQFYSQFASSLARNGQEIYFSSTPGFRAINCTYSTSDLTVTDESADVPIANPDGRYVYRAGQTAPFTYQVSGVLRLTAKTNNATVTFSKKNYSNCNYIYITYRNTKSSLTAGDFKIILKSSTGNQVTLTSQKTALQNEWVWEIFDFRTPETGVVDFLGTPDFDVPMSTEAVVTVSGDTIEAGVLYAAQSQTSFPNYLHNIPFADYCLETLAREDGYETFNIECANRLKDKIGLKHTPTYTLKLKSLSADLMAALYGTNTESMLLDGIESNKEFTVTSGIVDLGGPLSPTDEYVDVKKVMVNSDILSMSLINKNLETHEYYVNYNAGTITLNGGYPDGTKVYVDLGIKVRKNGWIAYNTDFGVIGRLNISMKQGGNELLYNYVAKLMPKATEFNPDKEFTFDVDLNILALDGYTEQGGM